MVKSALTTISIISAALTQAPAPEIFLANRSFAMCWAQREQYGTSHQEVVGRAAFWLDVETLARKWVSGASPQQAQQCGHVRTIDEPRRLYLIEKPPQS
jgi:hypothetical protein